MDTTLIAAVVSALATIIAALVTALVGQRTNASRERERLEAFLHGATVIGRRVSTAEQPEERAFLEDNLDLISQVTPPLRGGDKPDITVSPREPALVLVVQKGNPRPAFNLMLLIENSGQQLGIVDGLEAILTGPEGVGFRFQWNLFYAYQHQHGRMLHTMSSYIHPVAVPPGGGQLLGIQFIGPDLGIGQLYSWPTGRYQVEITGWVNGRSFQQSTNSSRCYIEISTSDIAQLKEWVGWDDAAWSRFADPDNAAGLSVRIASA